jgi:hypothetical protein
MNKPALVLQTHSFLAVLSLTVWLTAPGADALDAQTIAYTGATVWDGTAAAPIVDATLLVENGVVQAVGTSVTVPASATVIPLDGSFVIPGLVNTHGHVTGRWSANPGASEEARVRADLLLYARYGITTVASLGDGDAAIRVAATAHGRARHARLIAAGPVITERTPEAARARARANVEGGASWLKLRVDDNLGASDPMPWDAVEAVFEVARETGVPVATHIFYLEDARRLLEMGTGMVGHSVRDVPGRRGLHDRARRIRRLLRTHAHARGEHLRLRRASGLLRRPVLPALRARERSHPVGRRGGARPLPGGPDRRRISASARPGDGEPTGAPGVGRAHRNGHGLGARGSLPGVLRAPRAVAHGASRVSLRSRRSGARRASRPTASAATTSGSSRPAGKPIFSYFETIPTRDIDATRTLERVFVGGIEIPMTNGPTRPGS